MSDIYLHNTASKSIELFTPLQTGKVGVYSCGPTVYHYAHIGNMRAYVFADILRRTLVHKGYEVTHVINITDVGHTVNDDDQAEDKMEKGSRREGKTAWDIATFYTESFMRDISLLNIPKSAYIFPRATDNIKEQIAIIQKLEEKGYTYTTSDGVYFDTAKFDSYADFAHLDVEGLQSGARVEENKEKRNITDFALWKFSPRNEKRQMEWESPWGVGFPGWHIECSAMSTKYLGNHFDIHTGGIDHIPVHHTNEIAQSEAAFDEKYASYWMHVNFLHDTTGKMSKSNDDFLTMQTLIQKGYDPLAYRYFLLTAHYRKEIAFSFESLDAASVAYEKLWNHVAALKTTDVVAPHAEYMSLFTKALYDDLATPAAIALLWKLVADSIPDAEKYATILEMDKVLGLGLEKAAQKEIVLTKEVEELLDARSLARQNRDYKEADRLRDELKKHGFAVKDTQDGQEIVR